MPRADFPRRRTAGTPGGSDTLDDHIEDVARSFDGLGNVVNNDKLINVEFTADDQDQTVSHGLGTTITSVDVVRKNAASDVYEVSSDKRTVTLHATKACKVTVRIH